jgi:hypothetical protein
MTSLTSRLDFSVDDLSETELPRYYIANEQKSTFGAVNTQNPILIDTMVSPPINIFDPFSAYTNLHQYLSIVVVDSTVVPRNTITTSQYAFLYLKPLALRIARAYKIRDPNGSFTPGGTPIALVGAPNSEYMIYIADDIFNTFPGIMYGAESIVTPSSLSSTLPIDMVKLNSCAIFSRSFGSFLNDVVSTITAPSNPRSGIYGSSTYRKMLRSMCYGQFVKSIQDNSKMINLPLAETVYSFPSGSFSNDQYILASFQKFQEVYAPELTYENPTNPLQSNHRSIYTYIIKSNPGDTVASYKLYAKDIRTFSSAPGWSRFIEFLYHIETGLNPPLMPGAIPEPYSALNPVYAEYENSIVKKSPELYATIWPLLATSSASSREASLSIHSEMVSYLAPSSGRPTIDDVTKRITVLSEILSARVPEYKYISQMYPTLYKLENMIRFGSVSSTTTHTSLTWPFVVERPKVYTSTNDAEYMLFPATTTLAELSAYINGLIYNETSGMPEGLVEILQLNRDYLEPIPFLKPYMKYLITKQDIAVIEELKGIMKNNVTITSITCTDQNSNSVTYSTYSGYDFTSEEKRVRFLVKYMPVIRKILASMVTCYNLLLGQTAAYSTDIDFVSRQLRLVIDRDTEAMQKLFVLLHYDSLRNFVLNDVARKGQRTTTSGFDVSDLLAKVPYALPAVSATKDRLKLRYADVNYVHNTVVMQNMLQTTANPITSGIAKYIDMNQAKKNYFQMIHPYLKIKINRTTTSLLVRFFIDSADQTTSLSLVNGSATDLADLGNFYDLFQSYTNDVFSWYKLYYTHTTIDTPTPDQITTIKQSLTELSKSFICNIEIKITYDGTLYPKPVLVGESMLLDVDGNQLYKTSRIEKGEESLTQYVKDFNPTYIIFDGTTEDIESDMSLFTKTMNFRNRSNFPAIFFIESNFTKDYLFHVYNDFTVVKTEYPTYIYSNILDQPKTVSISNILPYTVINTISAENNSDLDAIGPFVNTSGTTYISNWNQYYNLDLAKYTNPFGEVYELFRQAVLDKFADLASGGISRPARVEITEDITLLELEAYRISLNNYTQTLQGYIDQIINITDPTNLTVGSGSIALALLNPSSTANKYKIEIYMHHLLWSLVNTANTSGSLKLPAPISPTNLQSINNDTYMNRVEAWTPIAIRNKLEKLTFDAIAQIRKVMDTQFSFYTKRYPVPPSDPEDLVYHEYAFRSSLAEPSIAKLIEIDTLYSSKNIFKRSEIVRHNIYLHSEADYPLLYTLRYKFAYAGQIHSELVKTLKSGLLVAPKIHKLSISRL